MAYFPKTLTSPMALCFATLWAAPSLADITPEQLWQNWQDSSAALGQTIVAGNVAREGDALVITDVTMASAANGTTVEGSLDTLTMTDQGDGTVLVTSSPEFPMKMRLPAAQTGGPDLQISLRLVQEGMTMLASGTGDDIAYTIDAPALTVRLDRIDGPAGQAENLTIDATLTNLAGTYTTKMAQGDAGGVQVDSDITVQGVALAVLAENTAKGSDLRLTAAMEQITSVTSGTLLGPLGYAGGATPPVMDSQSSVSIAATQFDLEGNDDAGLTTASGTMGPVATQVNIAGGVMEYAVQQSALEVTLNAPGIPVPDLAITLDTANLALKTPIAAADMAMPFAFSTSLQNLAFSDQLWALFDPAGSLPRDPINFVIDTEGMAKPNAMPADPAATLPAELESLTLKDLRLSVAGAELVGAGTSTFQAVPGGMPNPNAKLDFTLTGANALMDKLVSAGLLTPEALTMPRMMLAMVARPAADGSDSYESAIEIRDKSIFANGQMLHQME